MGGLLRVTYYYSIMYQSLLPTMTQPWLQEHSIMVAISVYIGFDIPIFIVRSNGFTLKLYRNPDRLFILRTEDRQGFKV